MPNRLPEHVLQFIARHVESLEKLEVLLALAENPEHFWSVDEMFHRIQSSHASVLQRMRELKRENLAETNPDDPHQFRFQPGTAEPVATIAELAAAYRERRLKVIEAVFSKTDDQLRRFSDAFKLRKDEE